MLFFLVGTACAFERMVSYPTCLRYGASDFAGLRRTKWFLVTGRASPIPRKGKERVTYIPAKYQRQNEKMECMCNIRVRPIWDSEGGDTY